MITLNQLTELFGWASFINVVMLMLIGTLLIVARDKIAAIHSQMFDISSAELSKLYFDYLGRFKMLVIVFAIVPYISLKLMGY